MEIVLFWFIFSFAVGIFADNKGRSGFGWFLFSVLLSPLLGLIFVAIAKPNKDILDKRLLKKGKMKKCPFCAELVKKQAVVCRYCQSELSKQ